MSVLEQNKALMYRWFEEVWNQRKTKTIDELMVPDVVAHGLPGEGGVVHGAEAFKASYHLFTGAFPDLTIRVDQVLAEGDMAMARFTCRGTHLGETLGVAASQQPVEFVGMTIAHIKDGQIVEGWNVVDFLTMQKQIGLVP